MEKSCKPPLRAGSLSRLGARGPRTRTRPERSNLTGQLLEDGGEPRTGYCAPPLRRDRSHPLTGRRLSQALGRWR